MSATYKLNKHCPVCGRLLADKNKSGYCNLHRDRTGENNPFYGKKHSDEVLSAMKEKCKNASLKKWENEEYVKHVKDGLKSEKNINSHKSENFKEKQRIHAIQQMKDDKQRKLRSEIMKESWKSGKIEFHVNTTPNFSKDEIEFGEMLKEALKENSVYLERNFKIKRKDKGYYCPDFKYKNFIIEFDGDFWHAHNKEDNEIIHHNITAKEIREKDNQKTKFYEELGYTVIRVWQSEYLNNKQKIIEEIKNRILL